MDSDEFVARMIAAGVPDIEAAAAQPPSPKVKTDPNSAPATTAAGAGLIPAAPEDNLANQPSQPSLASKLVKATVFVADSQITSTYCHIVKQSTVIWQKVLASFQGPPWLV